MAIPLAAISAGIGIAGGLKSLFGGGGRKKYRGARQFSYTPNEQDPELLLRRRRALEEITRSRDRDVNEIGRAGLLGSSAAFGVLGEGESRGARTLEDIDADVYGNRRQEALGLFRDEENFERQLALGDQSQQGRERMLGLESLGNIGEFAGGFINGGEDEDYSSFLRRRSNRKLPRRALLDSLDYEYEIPNRRGRYM